MTNKLVLSVVLAAIAAAVANVNIAVDGQNQNKHTVYALDVGKKYKGNDVTSAPVYFQPSKVPPEHVPQQPVYGYPTTHPQHPTTHPQNPTTRPQHPTTRPQYPTTDPQYPTTDPQYPAIHPQYPNTDPRYPATDPQYPNYLYPNYVYPNYVPQPDRVQPGYVPGYPVYVQPGYLPGYPVYPQQPSSVQVWPANSPIYGRPGSGYSYSVSVQHA